MQTSRQKIYGYVVSLENFVLLWSLMVLIIYLLLWIFYTISSNRSPRVWFHIVYRPEVCTCDVNLRGSTSPELNFLPRFGFSPFAYLLTSAKRAAPHRWLIRRNKMGKKRTDGAWNRTPVTAAYSLHDMGWLIGVADYRGLGELLYTRGTPSNLLMRLIEWLIVLVSGNVKPIHQAQTNERQRQQ